MHRNVVEETTKPATILAVFVVAAALAAGSAADDEVVRGQQAGCFVTIQAAVDAAKDGDTIQISPGTFAGGITIDKSVSLVGVSKGATTIEGGGPVITLGELDGVDQPTISISRVTITGGFNHSAPPSFAASGGGVWIPPGARTRQVRRCRSPTVSSPGTGPRPRRRFRCAGIRARSPRARHQQLRDVDRDEYDDHGQRRGIQHV